MLRFSHILEYHPEFLSAAPPGSPTTLPRGLESARPGLSSWQPSECPFLSPFGARLQARGRSHPALSFIVTLPTTLNSLNKEPTVSGETRRGLSHILS